MSAASGSITIVGGGLAGGLLAIYLARKGLSVRVFERRPDMRRTQISAGRSINLALSTRGIHALHEVGLKDELLRIAIPMRGRMIHPLSGSLIFAPYGKDDTEYINSVSRAALNTSLLNAAQGYPNIELRFDERCVGMDFESGEAWFEHQKTGKISTVKTDTIIATDGAFSVIREEMLKTSRFNYSQSYLAHSYKELAIAPAANGAFKLEKNALHIWPRGGYMLIALPNLDGSFTCTLFFPHTGELSFESLSSKERVQTFFSEQFPDVVPLLENLTQTFFSNPTGELVTVKCSPWHIGRRALLVGDAAHAIVPFYGQGMNCAFEDCSYLSSCVDQYGPDWERVFVEYERLRKVNTDAIADLALDNFVEMRDGVANPKFLLKKELEHALEHEYPGKFISKYSMVTFHRIPYAEAMHKGRIQDEIIAQACSSAQTLADINLSEVYNAIVGALR